jgi:hypothetical protein
VNKNKVNKNKDRHGTKLFDGEAEGEEAEFFHVDGRKKKNDQSRNYYNYVVIAFSLSVLFCCAYFAKYIKNNKQNNTKYDNYASVDIHDEDEINPFQQTYATF